MSYDLAVWEGPRPESDAVAAVEFARRVSEMDRLYDAGEPMTEPSAAIREFVATVEERYPDDEDDPGASPWAVFPLIGNAVGDGIFIPMTYPGCAVLPGRRGGDRHLAGAGLFRPPGGGPPAVVPTQSRWRPGRWGQDTTSNR